MLFIIYLDLIKIVPRIHFISNSHKLNFRGKSPSSQTNGLLVGSSSAFCLDLEEKRIFHKIMHWLECLLSMSVDFQFGK